MKSLKNNQSGFTLIELLVVIIIVAVLAAVGIPLMTSNVDKAKLTEAMSGLGTIRTLERARLAETAAYPATQSFGNLGMKTGDLLGRYFDDGNYKVISFSTQTINGTSITGYCAGVKGGATAINTDTGFTNVTAPATSQATGLTRSIDHDGIIYDNEVCTGNVLNG